MQRYNDVPKQINTEGLGRFKTSSYLRWWLWLAVISSLATGTLACGLFNPSSNRLIIHARLPTLTPTAILPPEAGQISEKAAVAPPSSLLVSTSAPFPTPAPAGPVLISSANAGQAMSELPLLTPSVVLNVRAGPGVDYAVVGQLAQGQSTEIFGQNPEGTWWQVAYPPNSDNPAWVSADIQYSIVSNVDGVPIAQVPVQSTATTTTVPAQPTATPTPTSTSIATIQPTESPEATSTLTVYPLARPTTPPQDRATLPVPAGMRPSVD